MKTEIIPIKGMHCASCASIIEKVIKKTEGVARVEVNFGTEKAKISFDPAKTAISELSKKIEPYGYSFLVSSPVSTSCSTATEIAMSESEYATHLSLNQSKEQKIQEINDLKRKVISIIPLALISTFIMGWDIGAEFGYLAAPSLIIKEFFHHLLPLFATYALFVVGNMYLLGVYRFFKTGIANMDSLIGIGTSAAYLYSFFLSAFEEPLAKYINVEQSYYDVTIVVIAFITLGKFLEARSKLKTGSAIERLLHLQEKTALVMQNGKEVQIAISEVKIGDQIMIKPGSRIPVDGVVVEGGSFIDESMISGEPMPVIKNTGDSVAAGTMNTSGAFVFEARRVGTDTFLARIIRMVEEAQGSRAPIQGLADRISAVFVPIVLVLAFITLFAWLVLGTAPLGFSFALSYGLTSFMGILVIACPCALGLATPTAIIVGIGKGAEEGILVKDAATLEQLSKATVIAVDKTGTLTEGKPQLTSLKNFSKLSDNRVISILASLEAKSEHPIASAIVSFATEKNISLLPVSQFESIRGKGLKGVIKGAEYFAGSPEFIKNLSLSFEMKDIEKEAKSGKTPILLADKERVIALILVADKLKFEARKAVAALHALGLKVIMMTGDDKNTGESIGREAGIDTILTRLLPDQKLLVIEELQKKGEIVAMLGDGINDAPALAKADVGIAMGTGTDVAIESAGITLLHGDISKLVKAVHLSRLTLRGIRQNLFWAFIYNLVGIPIASGVFFPFVGWLLSPVFAGFAMAFSSVSVITNSLRLKLKKI
ncbi:MAG: cadmium-translocating P-type ATPase [Candidatus Harrisonbacteria bacterium]|nr:cadmium-translocating P-type ATPase [Candidatus Harrisonbacteria bacterium]